MHPMQTNTARNELLIALRVLFELAQADISATETLLGDALQMRGVRLATILVTLRHLGLVQKGSLRLTMAGLVTAVDQPRVLDLGEDNPIVSAA